MNSKFYGIMKHAFLIMAHTNFTILKKLVMLLDDERNDVYIHIDKKVKEKPNLCCEKAGLYVLDKRIDVRWATVKQIELEFLMFQTAYQNGPYQYYHLLSGVDLPIKTNDYIHCFFERYAGLEFVGFVDAVEASKHLFKVQLFHFFTSNLKDKQSLSAKFHRKIMLWQFNHHLFLRNRHIDFQKGANWVSVTNDFVTYLLSKKKETLKRYKFTYGADEIFLQTILWNSSFRYHIYNVKDEYVGCMREICWNRGNPYIWTEADYDELMNSDKLFARKFDESHLKIVNRIVERLQQ